MPLNLVRDRRSARGQVCTFWLSACMCVCVGHDRYYICSTYICGFAAMAYFAMLSGQGWTAIAGCRQFFYARCCTAGLHWAGALDLTRGNDKSWRLVLSEHDKMAGSRTTLSPCPSSSFCSARSPVLISRRLPAPSAHPVRVPLSCGLM
jgi:hypothetical protein